MQAVTVATATKEAAAMHSLAALPRALFGGTAAMRNARERYLPKAAAESDAQYVSRLSRSFLFNAFGKTVADMAGKVFSKPVILEDDVPAPLAEWAENIDLAGRHINVFAHDVFKDAMLSGIGYILTDMPPALPGATLADEQRAGIRPYLVYIPVERVLGWKSTLVDGAETLTMFRYMELVKEADGEFAEKEIEQVRVLEPGKWRTFRKFQDTWVEYASGETSLNKIAVAPVYLNRTEFFQAEPPLTKLAELNVAHWQSSSDQRNILHVARVPILFMAGFTEDDQIKIGASEAVRSSNPDATMAYVEHTGAAIEAGRNDVKDIELQMQAMGLQLLMDAPGGQTATGEMRDDAKENSPLAAMARALGDALEQSFGFMAEFVALDGGGSIVVNTDFGVGDGIVDVPNIIAAYTAGLIDAQTGLDELKRRGFLSDSVDAEIVLDRIAAAAPDLTARTPMDLGGGNGPATFPTA